MKAILISIKPEWVAKILGREKTIEIRGNAPKCKLPIDVFIYCTKNDNGLRYWGYHMGGRIFAKFTLKKIERIYINVKEQAKTFSLSPEELCKSSCLDEEKIWDYLTNGNGYVWHISDLVIFDKPKELNYFKQWKIPYPKRIKWSSWQSNYYTALGAYVKQHPTMMVSEIKRTFDESISMKKAPQSWCYVENN